MVSCQIVIEKKIVSSVHTLLKFYISQNISKENLQKITARISEVSINLVYCIIIYTAVLWTETQLLTPAPLSTEYTGFKPESENWCGNTALLPRFSLQGRCCCPDARNTTSRERAFGSQPPGITSNAENCLTQRHTFSEVAHIQHRGVSCWLS